MGNFVVTWLLMPLLGKTAQCSPPGSVRVVWPGSIIVELNTPKSGFRQEWLQDPASVKECPNYVELSSAPKAGRWFLVSEVACRHQ